MVFGRVAKRLERRSLVQVTGQTLRLRAIEEPLGHAERFGRLSGNFSGDFHGLFHDRLVGNHVIHQPHPQRFFSIQYIAGKDHLTGFGHPDHPRQKPCPAVARYNADVEKGFSH